jgi:hypothetical protein
MRYKDHKEANSIFSSIQEEKSLYFIIHYSCESFYGITDGRTPRITSIAVRSYKSGQTDSFSIHKTAEIQHITNISEHYDELERKMLDNYFEYIRIHQDYKWIHWNMRDINYGFKAIEHRYQVLGGEPTLIPDDKKIDIARLMIQKYSVQYVGNPRMEKLYKLNKIKPLDWLSGADEAKAFENKEYIRLHQSTLRKVDIIANLLERAANNTLITESKWYQIYGLTPQGIFEFTRDNWLWQIIINLAILILGAFIGKVL